MIITTTRTELMNLRSIQSEKISCKPNAQYLTTLVIGKRVASLGFYESEPLLLIRVQMVEQFVIYTHSLATGSYACYTSQFDKEKDNKYIYNILN